MDFIQTEAYPSSIIYDKEPESLDSELASSEPVISIDFSKVEIVQEAALEALLDPIMYTIIPSPVVFTFPNGMTANFSGHFKLKPCAW